MASDFATITPTVVGGAAARRWIALAPGTEVGRYKIVAVLGHGGMGVIYRARDPALSRDVALKLLHPYQAFLPRADERHARLLTEARVLAQLSHPNVVAAYDVGTHDGAVFVAMELVDGESLRVWLERPRRRREVIDALVGAGRGLAAAHEAGVLH
ncbi:MAG: protein kinase domain-containing protein, partial [Solirubrobacteraceae bacterium]